MFTPIEQSSNPIKFFVCDYDAVDEGRQLALRTTMGRARNKKKWFVVRYTLPSGRTDYESGHIMFRAWTLDEALDHIKEPRIEAKIRERFGL